MFRHVRDSILCRPHGGILGRSQTGGQCPSPIPLGHRATHRLPRGKSTCRLNFLYIVVLPGWHSSVRKASCEFEAERHKAAKEKRCRQTERAASLPSSSQTFVRPKCGRGCVSRIGLYSHQRACKKLTLNLPNNPCLRGMSQSTTRGYIKAEYEF